MFRVDWNEHSWIDIFHHDFNLLTCRVTRRMRLDEIHPKVLQPVMEPLIIYEHLLIEGFTERVNEQTAVLRFDVDQLPKAVEANVSYEPCLFFPNLLCVPGVRVG